ncbi:PEP-utilizing enzyme [Methylotenera sp.]|uniref:PEP-utilizing enzyme n=1 Tax=Methylotenera sp. TaxID=2051956 RepID=UPI002ED81E88
MNKIEVSQAFKFGTKAETLWNLKDLVTEALVPEIYFFTRDQWSTAKLAILDEIHQQFGNSTLAVRSSGLNEDGANSSMAGAFLSNLNVHSGDCDELTLAIEQVLQSMSGNPRDQVLVQPMISDIEVSGVIMTFDMVNGAPYFCIDFDDESGRTDVVTSGNGIHKSLFVYRDAHSSLIRSPRIAQFLSLARELEAICKCAALDIEFGMNKAGQLFLFQVRRIALARHWHPVTERRVKRQLAHVEDYVRNLSKRRDGILGERTILAVMPDWNPAEIIGTTPKPLAASLYRELITKSVWRNARASMGYRALDSAELMLLINSHPYIDVRNSFNSFLPASISEAVGEKLVNAWLDRLEAFPEFHDKVEFEIVPTCLDFFFTEDFKARYPALLNDDEFEEYRKALTELTHQCLASHPDNTLYLALRSTEQLERLEMGRVNDEGYVHLARAEFLLTKCKEFGTSSFAVVARHAFIAEALLRSAVRRGALSDQRLTEFKRSIQTITGSMLDEYAQVCNGQFSRLSFFNKYGHLRPGTYEVTSLRYDERDDLFVDAMAMPVSISRPEFKLSDTESTRIDSLLHEAGFGSLNPEMLLRYAEKAIAAREYVKFVFTRSLSDALSEIVRWGESYGLSRDDISYLEWPQIVKSLTQPVMDDVDRYYLDIAESARGTMSAAHAFRLGHIVYGVQDIYVATLNRSVPNFIGLGAASGRVFQLEANTPTTVNIKNCIICIENADPGFDWIFTKEPMALITRFGGANSHMAVRCAELGLPAAIGCGDQIFQRVLQAESVELNCADKILRPLYVN